MPLLFIGAAAGAVVTWWATGTTEKLVKVMIVGGVIYGGYRYVTK